MSDKQSLRKTDALISLRGRPLLYQDAYSTYLTIIFRRTSVWCTPRSCAMGCVVVLYAALIDAAHVIIFSAMLPYERVQTFVLANDANLIRFIPVAGCCLPAPTPRLHACSTVDD